MQDMIKQWQDSQRKKGLKVRDAYYAPPEIKIRHNFNLLKSELEHITKNYHSLKNSVAERNFKEYNELGSGLEKCQSYCHTIASELIKYKDLKIEDNAYENPFKILEKAGIIDYDIAAIIHGGGLFFDFGAPRLSAQLYIQTIISMIEIDLKVYLNFAEAMIKLLA